MTFQTSLKLFSENLTSGQCTKSANYILAKLIDWLTPTSNCLHVRHLFHCILYMCQVRHVRQATAKRPKHLSSKHLPLCVPSRILATCFHFSPSSPASAGVSTGVSAFAYHKKCRHSRTNKRVFALLENDKFQTARSWICEP